MKEERREERKQKRKTTYAFFGINDQSTNNFVGWVVDMTIEGLRIRSISELEIDSSFRFRMDLPFKINESTEIVFDAKSVWSKKVNDRNEFNTGFELLDVSPTEIDKIGQLIESSHFEDGDEQIPVTFNLLKN